MVAVLYATFSLKFIDIPCEYNSLYGTPAGCTKGDLATSSCDLYAQCMELAEGARRQAADV